jgi:hypothetical protein
MMPHRAVEIRIKKCCNFRSDWSIISFMEAAMDAHDREVTAIQKVVAALEGMPPTAVKRVLDYARARFLADAAAVEAMAKMMAVKDGDPQ